VDRIEGQGKLENWEHPDKRIPVRYRFDFTAEVIETRGPRRVGVRRSGVGVVEALSGEPIPEGDYRLFAESDNEVLKVQTAGLGEWAVVAS
jgi:hypothetical protein